MEPLLEDPECPRTALTTLSAGRGHRAATQSGTVRSALTFFVKTVLIFLFEKFPLGGGNISQTSITGGRRIPVLLL